jgi:ferritin
MLKQSVLDGLNKQIATELTAAYGYLSLSVWFEQQVLEGFKAYFLRQMQEEQGHAMKILTYVQDQSGIVKLDPVPAPRQQFSTFLDAAKAAREAERNNTASINAVYATAVKEGDLPTQRMLDWFITEQVEEEKWTEDLVALAQRVGDNQAAILELDEQWGAKKSG